MSSSFRVGDWVIVTSTARHNADVHGQQGIVMRVFGCGTLAVALDNGDEEPFSACELELVNTLIDEGVERILAGLS